MSIATASHLEIAPSHPLLMRLAIAVGCVALADWLFYGWGIGISLALFLGTLGVVAVAGNQMRATRNLVLVMTGVFIAGLLALVEDVNMLSVTWAAAATTLFVIVVTAHDVASWQRYLFEAATVPLRGPFQLFGDLIGALRHMNIWTPKWLGWLVAWIVPLGIFAVFLALLSSANPLIEYRLRQIDLRFLINLFDPQRIGFWILIVCAIWPLVHRRIKRTPVRPPKFPAATVAGEPSDLDYLLGEKAMARSLILFNALFALQSALDLTYLWGGASLPDGMGHAEYAHRGAYPLIVTALLAAGFVLIAMRPGGPAEHSRLIRPLVLVWTGQNVLLVISAIFRLDLYVAAYSLTYWRLAAFIWMLLVAAGLLLMLIQMILRKPNSWLLAANALSMALVLYGCCFINAPRLIAYYNIEHSRQLGGTGPNLDLHYLASLGPEALPALEPHIKKIPEVAIDCPVCVGRGRFRHPGNWREWGYRTWRLERYLSNNPSTPQTLSKNDRG